MPQLQSRSSDSFFLITAKQHLFPRVVACAPLGLWQLVLSSAQHLCLLNLSWLIFPPSSSRWHVVAVLILHQGLAGCWTRVLQLHSKAAASFWVSRALQPWAPSQGWVGRVAGGPGGQVWHEIRLTEGGQKGQLRGEIACKSYF